jgi:hypothetical protein
MDLTLSNLLALARLTVQSPRLGAQAVMRLPLPGNARWAAMLLLAVMSALLMQGMTYVLPPVGPNGEPVEPVGPFFWAGMVAGGMVLTTVLVHRIGKWRGGTGRFDDALILVVWLQFIQMLLVVVQLVLLFVLPPAATLVEVLAVALFLWLLTNFVAELHGFRSLGLVFLGVILTFVASVFVMSILLLPFMSLGV